MISRGFITLVAGSDKQQILCLPPSHEKWAKMDALIDYVYINDH
jgi:2-keto-3-deoxy-galactonokinase